MLVLPAANAVWCRGVYPAYARQSQPLSRQEALPTAEVKARRAATQSGSCWGFKGVGGFQLIYNKISKGLVFYSLLCRNTARTRISW